MRKRPIVLVAWMLLILAFTVLIGLIISCGSAPEKEPSGPELTEHEVRAALQAHRFTVHFRGRMLDAPQGFKKEI